MVAENSLEAIAREYAKQLKTSIREQAQAFEAEARAAGYCKLPAHFRTAQQRQQAARRLYRYVIEGKTWEEVAAAEAGRRGPDYAPVADTVRKTACALARLLNIPLEPTGAITDLGVER